MALYPPSLPGNVFHNTPPLTRVRRLCDHFQIADELSNRAAHLMSEHEPPERLSQPLPLLRQRAKPDVLSEEDPPQLRNPFQQNIVRKFVRAVLTRRNDVHPAK